MVGVVPTDEEPTAARPGEDWPRRDALRLALGACAATAASLTAAGCSDETGESADRGHPGGAAPEARANADAGEGAGPGPAPTGSAPAKPPGSPTGHAEPPPGGPAARSRSAGPPSGPASHHGAASSPAKPASVPPSASGSATAAGGKTTPASGMGPQYERAARATDAVALTFHGDGPPELAEALLAEVERAGAKITVLAVGRWLEEHPQMARRILDGGHALGNHTENHLNISSMSASAAFAEIDACARRLEKLTGGRGRWFRPSDARLATRVVRAAAARAGYHTVLSYDIDPLDYTDPGPAAVRQAVLGTIRGGDVVSLHLGHPGTVKALPEILDTLRGRGLRAVTADDLFPLPLFPPPR
jgi:peptidoglycan/xylan/chitin deacetylase (PgdA/CDA1 family)